MIMIIMIMITLTIVLIMMILMLYIYIYTYTYIYVYNILYTMYSMTHDIYRTSPNVMKCAREFTSGGK